MKNKKMQRIMCLFTIIGFLFIGTMANGTPLLAKAATGDFETGKIIEHVTCLAQQDQSYALYLPPNYDNNKKWPIIYTFEPAARATVPLELFQEAAGKYGYILVCSYNIHNGPWPDIITGLKAMWQDTNQRLAIDKNHILTAGFSGGAKVAAAFPHITGNGVRGIIAAGAGLPGNLNAKQIQPAYYYGIVGLEDFNYKEFVQLGMGLTAAGTDFVFEVFDGPHRWPPVNICTRAVRWMEIWMADTKNLDSPTIEEIYQDLVNAGQAMQDAGKLEHAAKYFRAASTLFTHTPKEMVGETGIPIVDAKALLDKAKNLEASDQYKKFLQAENQRNKKELEYIGQFVSVFAQLGNIIDQPLPLSRKIKQACSAFHIPSLLKQADWAGKTKTKDIFNRAMARRLLHEIVIKADREGVRYLELKQYKTAQFFLEIGFKACPSEASMIYHLAILFLQQGKKKKALDYLENTIQQLIKNGAKHFSFIKTDKSLDPLRKEPRFLKILDQLKNRDTGK